MDEDYGSTFITVSDEDGNEFELEHLDTIEHNGETYMAFGLAEEDEDQEEIEVVIMHVVEQDDEELFEEVTDEALMEEVYKLFMERLETDDEDAGSEV